MWFFNSPKITFGEDALSRLAELDGERVFIVCDETMVRLGFAAKVQEQLDAAGLVSEIFDGVEPDPSLAIVRRAAAAMAEFGPDWVVGLGGGSSLDTAKAAWFLYERPDVDLAAINPFESFGLRSKARLITVATTSGTGADVSWGVALNDPEEQRKVVVVTPEMVPDIAIVDPALVMGLPPQITADTGIDALVQAIEGYANAWHNDFTDGLALNAIRLIFDYLPRAYANGADAEAREHLHNAATMAGLAFSNTAIVLAHALGHAVQALFHTIHGRTVGVLLPYTIQYTANGGHQGRYADIARMLGLPCTDDEEAVNNLVEAIDDLLWALGQPRTIAELGIKRDDFAETMPRLVQNAANSPEMVPSLRPPSEEEIERIFWCAYEGRDVDF